MAAPGGPKGALGYRAESAVVTYLEEAGYEIVARNLRLGRLELDIIARRATLIVVVEVRTRGKGSWTSAFGSLTRSKQERIRRAGQRLWRERYAHDATASQLRFDAACVEFGPDGGSARVDYVMAAF